MAVTTLTGTTWVLNNSIIISDNLLVEISFTSSLGNHSNFLLYKSYYDALVYAGPVNDNNQYTNSTFVYRTSSGWVNEDYRTITFTSEASSYQDSLIEWLLANATQVLPPDYIDKVVLPSEEEYNIKDTISGYLKGSDLVAGTNISIEETSEGQLEISSTDSGIAARIIKLPIPTITDLTGTTWYFNDHLQSLTPIGLYDITFINNNHEYIKIGNSSTYPDDIWYRSSSGTTYAYEEGWILQSYRTINITGGTDSTNSGFIAWLEANATQVS